MAQAAAFPPGFSRRGAVLRKQLNRRPALDAGRLPLFSALAACAHGDDPAWDAIATDTVLRDPRMKKHWEMHLVHDLTAGSVDVVTTPVGRITFDSASYQLTGDTQLSVLVGVPRTDQDRRLVEQLLAARDRRAD